ncbi:FxDxF family PEP-CTERM protein [Methylobacillus pratensis]
MKAMNLKAILLAVSLIGASAGAYANPALVGGDQNSSPDVEVYNFAHTGFIGNGVFSHILDFTVNGDRLLNASITASTPVGEISFTGFKLFSVVDGVVVGPELGYIANDITNPLPQFSFGFLTSNVSGPASYRLVIEGNAVLPQGFNGTYTGTITAAVPEPSTYGMLALGLGLIGFAARSRSKFSA